MRKRSEYFYREKNGLNHGIGILFQIKNATNQIEVLRRYRIPVAADDKVGVMIFNKQCDNGLQEYERNSINMIFMKIVHNHGLNTLYYFINFMALNFFKYTFFDKLTPNDIQRINNMTLTGMTSSLCIDKGVFSNVTYMREVICLGHEGLVK